MVSWSALFILASSLSENEWQSGPMQRTVNETIMCIQGVMIIGPLCSLRARGLHTVTAVS